MVEYSHRDRRAHRDVRRVLWAMVAGAVALTGIGLAVPLPFVGIAAVVGLGILGAVYLAWSEAMLQSYSTDLRLAHEGREMDGFVRVEVAVAVGLDRDSGGPRTLSPHARRRYPGTPLDSSEPSPSADSDAVQP